MYMIKFVLDWCLLFAYIWRNESRNTDIIIDWNTNTTTISTI